jgi:CRP-like cAMP-binding protein
MELNDKLLLSQFQRSEGTPLLADALKLQSLIRDQGLALEFARHVSLEAVPSGRTLIRQGASESDLFLILSGEFSVLINGELIGRRMAGEHLGAGQRRRSRSENVSCCNLSYRSARLRRISARCALVNRRGPCRGPTTSYWPRIGLAV